MLQLNSASCDFDRRAQRPVRLSLGRLDSVPFSTGEHLLQRCLKHTHVVVDYCLLLCRAVVTHQAYESKISIWSVTPLTLFGTVFWIDLLVDLSQVEVVVSFSLHCDQALGVVVACLCKVLVFAVLLATRPAVDFADIDDHVNVIGTYFVASNIGRASVSSDVNFAHDVEKVCLFDVASAAQTVQKRFERRKLRNELLDHLREGLKDRMIVNAGLIKGNRRVLIAVIRELILDPLDDVTEGVTFVIFRKTVDFMYKDLYVDVRVGVLQVEDGGVQAHDGFEVLILRVDDPYQRSDFFEDVVDVKGRVEVVQVARKVPDLEVHKGADCMSSKYRRASMSDSLHGFFLDPSRRLQI